jgi:hypothetical protein
MSANADDLTEGAILHRVSAKGCRDLAHVVTEVNP